MRAIVLLALGCAGVSVAAPSVEGSGQAGRSDRDRELVSQVASVTAPSHHGPQAQTREMATAAAARDANAKTAARKQPGARAVRTVPATRARPKPDASALRDAQQSAEKGREVSSSAAYAHFLNARLARAGGDDRAALEQLRLALASDPGNTYLLIAVAEAHGRVGEPVEARRILERLVSQDPDDARAHLLMGRVLHESGSKRAEHHLNRARLLAPTDPEPYLALIQLHLDRDDPAGAERIADALAKSVPGEIVAQRRLGQVLAETGEPRRAERLLRRALAHDPSDVEAWLLVAGIAEAGGRLDAAEVALTRALEHADDPAEVLLARGRLALRRGDQKAAFAHLTRLLASGASSEHRIRVALLWLGEGQPQHAIASLRPGDGAAREARLSFFAGLLLARLRQFDEAANAFMEAQGEPAFRDEAARERASALSRAGKHDEALTLLKTAVQDRPRSAGDQVAFAHALERAKRVGEAEQILRSNELHDEETVVVALAGLLQRTGRGSEAVEFLESTLKRAPESALVRQALGLAYARSGRAEEALRLVRRGGRTWPDHAPTLNFAGYLMAESGLRLDEAERLIRRAIALRPKTGAYLDSLGFVLLRQGRVEAALAALQEAAGLEPFEPVIQDHLGEALRRSGREAEARRHWQRALELGVGPDVDVPPGFREAVRGKLEALSEPPRAR